MSSVTPSAATLATLTAATPGAATAPGTTAPAGTAAPASVANAGTAGATQAQQGVTTVQKVEVFQAPMLRLPDSPATEDVLQGLVGAMANRNANATTVSRLKELHDLVFDAHKSMMQAMLQM
ncbi:MAG: hypothetical protein JWM25_1071 [Thermoleophilia bacterium]|nr:hypothetical protein [Thermoleophilia bacterium]